MKQQRAILVTGGSGFIGVNLISYILNHTNYSVINLDKLTYAANGDGIKRFSVSQRYEFIHGDICDQSIVEEILHRRKPFAVIHLAAESHVDRSIGNPGSFVQTNIFGTYSLVTAFEKYWNKSSFNPSYRFVHVSTDEVFGPILSGSHDERSSYKPSSPYSASKASADHLVRSWYTTYGLPSVIINSTNNFGPFQNHEKLIPLVIKNALNLSPIPVYGDGKYYRDWLFVEDHVRAIITVMEKGTVGESYCVGSASEKENIELVNEICDMVDEMMPSTDLRNRRSLIKFVKDRPGHDRRYAVDTAKIKTELGWNPASTFSLRLRETIRWYLGLQN